MKELQWFCERLNFISMLLIKGNYFLKGSIKSQNTVLQTLFSHSRKLVQLCNLCCMHNVEVALCCSGAIFSAVCNGFSQVAFTLVQLSLPVFCPFCLFNCVVCLHWRINVIIIIVMLLMMMMMMKMMMKNEDDEELLMQNVLSCCKSDVSFGSNRSVDCLRVMSSTRSSAAQC